MCCFIHLFDRNLYKWQYKAVYENWAGLCGRREQKVKNQSYFAISPLYKQSSHPPTNMYINIHGNNNNK